MRIPSTVLVAVLLAVAGCGDDDTAAARAELPARSATEKTVAQGDAPAARDEADASRQTGDGARQAATSAAGTRIAARRSRFGTMLWGPRRRAIYVFQRDLRGVSRCYGECAKAWPPVYTRGKPVAGRGVRQSLLGTTRRRGGRRQVTYRGRPLYYYVHEGAGEVRCHNVNLNGGLWWVIGPDGRRRP